MSREALRTQLDGQRVEMQRLQVENARLRDERPERATELDGEVDENSRLRAETERLSKELEELRGMLHESRDTEARAAGEAEAKRAEVTELERQLEDVREAGNSRAARLQEEECARADQERQLHRDQVDLERFRALESERRKWEEREQRLVEQLQEAKRADRSSPPHSPATNPEGRPAHPVSASVGGLLGDSGGIGFTEESGDAEEPALPQANSRSGSPHSMLPRGSASESTGAEPHPSSMLASALLAHQVPPIPSFTGEEDDVGEFFIAWKEQFDMVASLCGWDGRAKLVNLTTRLKKQAYAFYRSCTAEQRSSCDLLVAELSKRFTPVRLQGVQSSMFHDRKQKPQESVDAYAQDLRRLFYRAYPRVQQGAQETEDFGRSVLSYQFVAGLLPALRLKVAGIEGTFDQLLTRARFEEAKRRELGGATGTPTQEPRKSSPQPKETNGRNGPLPTTSSYRNQSKDVRCYNCGGNGHYAKNCPMRGRAAPQESRGRTGGGGKGPPRKVAAIVASEPPDPQVATARKRSQERVLQLRRELHQAELDDSLAEAAATLHVLTAESEPRDSSLGPTLSAIISFEGIPVSALLDTGSPVTIVSLSFLLQAFKRQRTADQTPAEWTEAVRRRMTPPSLTLHNYGGDPLSIIRQVAVKVSRGNHTCEATVLVQKHAPLDLLVGTDLLSSLGFRFLQIGEANRARDLLQETEWDVIPATSGEQPTGPDPPVPGCNKKGTTEVRLLTAVRLPARHGRPIRAKVTDVAVDGTIALFESKDDLGKNGVVAEDAAVELGTDSCVTLVVHNHTLETVHLPAGHIMGWLQSAELLPIPDMDEDQRQTALSDGVVRLLTSDSAPRVQTQRGGRKERLFEALDVSPALADKERQQLRTVLADHADVFALDPTELGSTEVVQHDIDTGDTRPIRQPARRIPFVLRHTIDDMVDDMLQQGIIRPSHSPWASPVVLVAKKDGSKRFCVDYRRLNSATKLDVFPLPRIDDSLDLLSHSKFFTTLDLASGYWQVKVAPDAVEKTAFTTVSGLYEFLVMPFGLCNAPATFQRLMESVLAGLARDVCTVYLDDIMVMGATFDEHIENLGRVLDRLRQAGLRLKPSKCHFAKKEVAYLGYIVTEGGIAADPKKVEAVYNFPTPTNLKSLRSFLGLASYYRRFVPNFSKVAHPLFLLTRKDTPFEWVDSCQLAFDELKGLLTTAPVLAFPDFKKEYLLETDASGLGLGAILAQRQSDGTTRPLAYASRSLQRHEQNYGVMELEALGVVWAVRHFHPYLYGNRCHVYTDHEALKSLLNTPHPSGKLARWGLSLQELDLHVHYRPGKSNANADALSRNPREPDSNAVWPGAVLAALCVEEQPAKDGEDTFRKRQREDPELLPMMEYLETGTLPEEEKRARAVALSSDRFELEEGILYHVEADKTLRVVLAECDRRQVFDEAHGGAFGGHLREAKMLGQLARHYWWPKMRADISRWCRQCVICASRHVGKPVRPPLTPIPVAGPFDRVGVDILQLPKSTSGNRYAVVFIDYLTKWPEVFATPDQSSVTVARLLVERIVCRHGVPAELLSDRGATFLSKLMAEVYRLMGIRKVNTTAYHPQTDGLVERFNRTLTDMLAKTVDKQGSNWDERLPYVLFSYRTSLQESTKESPFFLLYGRDARLPTVEALSLPPNRQVEDLNSYKGELVVGMAEAWSAAQTQVRKAQKRQKVQHDRHATDSRFQVGDRVYVYMPAEKRGKAYKFARPFRGPFRVVTLYENGADVRLVDKPQAEAIRVALNRVRRCPTEILSGSEPIPLPTLEEPTPSMTLEEPTPSPTLEEPTPSPTPPTSPDSPEGPAESGKDTAKLTASPSSKQSGCWRGRLRHRGQRTSEDAGE